MSRSPMAANRTRPRSGEAHRSAISYVRPYVGITREFTATVTAVAGLTMKYTSLTAMVILPEIALSARLDARVFSGFHSRPDIERGWITLADPPGPGHTVRLPVRPPICLPSTAP